MKAIKFSLLTALMISGMALAGCKSKSAGGDASGDGESSEPIPVYTISQDEYLSTLSYYGSPLLFINGNVTVSNFVDVKIANGKVDFQMAGSHSKFDIDTSSYDTSTQKAVVEEYDMVDSVWYHYHEAEFNMSSFYFTTQLYYFTALPTTFEALTYSEEAHKYTGSSEYGFDFELYFENAKLVSCVVKGEVDFIYEFSNYGKTAVEMPTEYQEGLEG